MTDEELAWLVATAKPHQPQQWRWYRRDADNDEPDKSDLEPEVFDALSGGVLSYSGNWRGYESEAAATDALRAAVAKYREART
jgi:hypothetical protein